ncbi:hypothetical protein GUITHDRAFT_162245 [Guillardia theta CCMP2712]|uniref:microtubule-severing ATPase n=1 Tax=Guillardia theta (strain CCMP2712) TaxID=905079 RepID=L1JLP5_GUITC|nr:hypothetical protein GUITHDRAFT_162245 [Guillardia theta CCMP2712]EKX49109.1 hypothetical protein GUITHDRAFT_162245 [Guillardia theta CCMP2712]|eukprot:XP_005836089.1 hypothetical protein GUITHDRAFT_162245 [Guillardia theta CCMP2712]
MAVAAMRVAVAAAGRMEEKEPLKAAEEYSRIVKALTAARSQVKSKEEDKEIATVIALARKRFDECEKRILQEKAAGAGVGTATATATATAAGARARAGAGAKGFEAASSSDKQTGSWLGWLWETSKPTQNVSKQRSVDACTYASVQRCENGRAMQDKERREPAATETGGPKLGSEGATATSNKAQSKYNIGSLKGIDRKLALNILDEVVDQAPGVSFETISGLKEAKEALKEAIILPSLRPDLFTGIRSPPRGILLFGPPGNGKTLLAKAVATECKCTFFNLSASSLTSKWVGESEKMVRALFALADQLQPSVIFMDEVDSLLTSRSAQEQDSSRQPPNPPRLKTEFLVQFDGLGTSKDSRVVVIGATNRPQGQKVSLNDREFQLVAEATKGFTGSDITAMCKDAAMGPIRDLRGGIEKVNESSVRGINLQDLREAADKTRPSVSSKLLKDLLAWNAEFGSYKA